MWRVSWGRSLDAFKTSQGIHIYNTIFFQENNLTLNAEQFTLLKYVKDMALIDLLNPTDPSTGGALLDHVQVLQNWCKRSKLQMNVAKMTEQI